MEGERTKEVRINVALSAELHRDLKELAKREHRSLRSQIAYMLEQGREHERRAQMKVEG